MFLFQFKFYFLHDFFKKTTFLRNLKIVFIFSFHLYIFEWFSFLSFSLFFTCFLFFNVFFSEKHINRNSLLLESVEFHPWDSRAGNAYFHVWHHA
jgi:hypothetical protein